MEDVDKDRWHRSCQVAKIYSKSIQSIDYEMHFTSILFICLHTFQFQCDSILAHIHTFVHNFVIGNIVCSCVVVVVNGSDSGGWRMVFSLLVNARM